MSPPVFVAEPARLRAAGVGDRVVLDGAEGRHAATVRRLRPGEPVVLTDAAGLVADCVVVEVLGREALELEVRTRREVPAPTPRFVVVQALAKGERGELAVELMTEVGVDVVVPWSASRSVVQWRAERVAKGLSRWRSTAHEAAKQARRAWFPAVGELLTTEDVVELVAGAALGVVLHEEAGEPLAGIALPTSGDVVLVVGPEGGIAPDELEELRRAGARPCRLGDTVLRTSTAGAAALAVLSARSRWA